MSSSSSKEIQITHIINAHLFWFKYINDEPDLNVEAIEKALENYAKENGEAVCADRSNGKYRRETIVAVYLRSKKKWIRAEVDEIDEPAAEDELIVWATDYGIPVKTTLDAVILLNTELKKACHETPSRIVKGGITSIIPASSKVNLFNETRMLEDKKWDPKVTETLNKMKSFALVKLHFDRKFNTNDHVFGDLTLRNDKGETKSIGNLLSDTLKFGIKVAEAKFMRDINASETINIKRWLDNNGDLNCTENKRMPSISIPSTPNFKPSNNATSSPVSQSKSPTTTTSSPKQAIPQPKEIDEYKLMQKLSQMQLVSMTETVRTSSTCSAISKIASALDSAQSVEKIHSRINKSRQLAPSATSTQIKESVQSTSTQIKEFDQSKKLAQINEPRLFNKIKSLPIFIRNNVEEPIDSVNSAQFTSAVHRGMRCMNLQETYLIQGYAWPNLLRGNSMVLVDSQNRGKTMAYLPVLCSKVQGEIEEAYEAEKGKERSKSRSKMGATAIIVCLTSNVKKIADDCRKIMQMPTFKSNVVEATCSDAVAVTVKLYNGCNILVATAPCLMDLIKTTPVLKGDRLKWIAFENLDCIMDKHSDTVDYIVKNLCSRKSYKGELRQFMITSRTWRSTLLKFMHEKDVPGSVLVIGNQMEAAFYANVLMHFRLCKNDVKLNEMHEQIKSLSYLTQRTMIVCNDSSEASEVAKYLESKKIPHELVIEIESNYAQSKVKSFWDKIEGILICTDAHLNGLQIKNVQHLLHFSVPTQDFRSFLNRHSTFLEFYDEGKNKEKATSTIIFGDDNFKQLPKLVDLLIRDGQQVPKHILEISQKARLSNIREKAEKRRYESVCNFIFMHGVSEHQSHCRHRHLLLPFDNLDDSNQMTSGHLRFNVLQIISPTEYIIRPTQHKTEEKANWETINSSDEFDDFNTKMQDYYKDTVNQKALHQLELGQKCVVSLHEIFYRAEIIAIFEKRKFTDVDTYEVRFIDTGEVEQRHAFELYTLDEQFQTLPNQAYHLHLTSIIPADKEDDWNPGVCEEIRKYLNKLNAKEDGTIYEANIVFSLRNTIVVDIMRLLGLRHGIVHCSIKAYLQRRKYGISSSANREKVIEMAKAAGIKIKPKLPAQSVTKTNSMPELATKLAKSSSNLEVINDIKTTSTRVESDTPLLSFDDSISDSVSQDEGNDKWVSPWKVQHKNVQISQFYSPHDFYVVQKSEKLEQMYRAIDEYIETTENDSMGCPDVYKYCLVHGSQGYNRAKVIEVIYGDDVQLKVFLVDTGFSTTVDVSIVYDIPDNLIQMLPFQAIWCNLVGIKPIDNNVDNVENAVSQWSEEQIDEIYNAIDNYGDELFLHTVSEDKSVKSKIPDTNYVRHDIVLLALPDEDSQIDINKMLVAKQLADFDPSTKHLLENVPILPNENHDIDSDTESDWEQDCQPNGNEQQNKWIMVNDPPSGAESPESDTGFEDISKMLLDKELAEEAEIFLRDLLGIKNNNTDLQMEPEANIKTKKTASVKYDYNNKLDNGYASTGANESEEGTESSAEDQGENSGKNSSSPTDRHQMEYIYKRPRVFWWQTDEIIVLKISAHDNVKYGLEITTDQLIYGTVENDEQFVAVIHFFGSVDHEFTSHEVRGLNVVVRLRKLCPIMWPRLLRTAQKCTWVIQNIDAIKDEEYYDKAIAQFEKTKRDSDSEEDSDEKIVPVPNFDLEDDERSFDEQSEGASF